MKNLQRFAATLAVLAATASVGAAQGVKVTETKPGLLKRAKITSDSAVAVARARLPKATIHSAEIEEEDGKLIFSFDMKTAGKSGIDEVNVDALTGKLVGKVQHESAADEKKEADDEAAKKPVKKPTL
jgi:uncharacterized membrane protein YkoI